MPARIAVALVVLASSCASLTPLTRAQELPVNLPSPESRALVVVRVPAPWWAPQFLIRVSFVTEPDGRAGAVSLWASRDAARAYWSDERSAAAAKALGVPVELTWFSAPVLLDAAAAKREAP